MTLLIISFLAGVLTVMAPCVLPLLPVIVGGSIASGTRTWYRPVVIATSLAISIVVFTLLLKFSTALLGIPAEFWAIVSSVIVFLLGVTLAFPDLWERFVTATRLNLRANALLGSSSRKSGLNRDILIGLSLGPVFTSCSPTYSLIVATVLPRSFVVGLGYLVAYAVGLALTLMLISLAGQSFARRLALISNPRGWFMRGIGFSFMVVAVAVLFGWDKDFQSYVLAQGLYDPIANIENSLRMR